MTFGLCTQTFKTQVLGWTPHVAIVEVRVTGLVTAHPRN